MFETTNQLFSFIFPLKHHSLYRSSLIFSRLRRLMFQFPLFQPSSPQKPARRGNGSPAALLSSAVT
jgi:hypothetical protein